MDVKFTLFKEYETMGRNPKQWTYDLWLFVRRKYPQYDTSGTVELIVVPGNFEPCIDIINTSMFLNNASLDKGYRARYKVGLAWLQRRMPRVFAGLMPRILEHYQEYALSGITLNADQRKR